MMGIIQDSIHYRRVDGPGEPEPSQLIPYISIYVVLVTPGIEKFRMIRL